MLFFALLWLCGKALAQDNDLQLARQYATNGDQQKALDIYQKLYRQNNEAYFSYYVNSLIALKKFDEAENVAKKIIRKHPGDLVYTTTLGKVYTQQGDAAKANAIYDDEIKNLPADPAQIANLGNLFFQAENADYAIKTFLQGRKLMKNDHAYMFELISLYRFKRDKAPLIEEYLNFLPENPAYLSQAEYILSSMFDGEADYAMLRQAVLRRMQKDAQQTVYVDLLTWQYLQLKDFDQALNQTLALSRRQNDDGNNVFELCRTLVGNQAYDTAIRGYEFLISKGKGSSMYIPAKIELINTKNLKVTDGKYTQADLLGLEKDYNDLLAEFGRNGSTAFAMQQLAHLELFKLHSPAKAQALLEDAIKVPDIQPTLLAECKLDLGDAYIITGQPWEATLTYSQVEKSPPNVTLKQEASFRNARMAYYTGDFKWAKGQLDVLKAATSQLIANDALNLELLITDNTVADTSGAALKMYARADLAIFEQETNKALRTLDSIDKKFPNNSLADDILMAKARIMLQQKDFAQAAALLKTIAEQHATSLWADDAVFMLGDLYENQLNDKNLAKTYYQKIITDYPGSLYINEARKRFRLLRGDKTDGA